MDGQGHPFGADFIGLQWGSPPVPLLPRALCREWAQEDLPPWVVAELHLAPGSTVAALDQDWWKGHPQISDRVEHYVSTLVRMRVAGIRKLRCFGRHWPPGLRLSELPLGTRSRHALERSGFFENPAFLMQSTFGRLLEIAGLGTMSLLEIVCLVDAAIDFHEQAVATVAQAGKTSHVGMNPGIEESLTGLLEEPWASQISEQDPRFAPLLAWGQGTLEERVERVLADPVAGVSEVARLLQCLPAVRMRVVAIAARSLEDSLMDFLSMVLEADGQRLEAVAARLGWRGEEPKTLQECGEQLGVTRERIRQIEQRFVQSLPPHLVLMPKLDEALVVLERAGILPLDEAAALLASEGVSKRPFSPVSLLEAARILGREAGLAIRRIRRQRVLAPASHADRLGKVVRLARSLAGQSGVGNVLQVVDGLALAPDPAKPQGDVQLGEDDVRAILRGEKACEFLDEDWFWFTDIPAGRNRLENLVRKMLSVAAPQAISSLREGVRRQFLYRSITNARYRSLAVPPMAVLTAFLRRHPEFRVDGDSVASIVPLDYREMLGEAEKVLTDVLRASATGVLDRRTFSESAMARGLNVHTLAVYLTYSPVLEHLGLDLWKLRGVHVDPASVQAVREQNQLRPRENRLLDFGWSPEGLLWIAWRVPILTSGFIFGIPGAVRRYLHGVEFRAVTKDGQRGCGQVTVSERGQSYGYNRFIRLVGADTGDTLLAEFDLTGKVVLLSLADEDVLG